MQGAFFLACSNRSRTRLAVSHADEVWTHLQGAPLSLWCLKPEADQATREVLSMHNPVQVIPADHWQAAKAEGPYSLVSCCVGPGFSFEDFTIGRVETEDG